VKMEGIEDGEMEPESPTEERKAPRPSVRNTQQLQRAYNWVKTFEEKVLQLLEPENVNIRKIGGVPAEEGLEEELNKVSSADLGHPLQTKTNTHHSS
jgi:hypothetical protein